MRKSHFCIPGPLTSSGVGFPVPLDTNYVVLTLNVSEAIRQDCSSCDNTAYVVLTLRVSEKRVRADMLENKPSMPGVQLCGNAGLGQKGVVELYKHQQHSRMRHSFVVLLV